MLYLRMIRPTRVILGSLTLVKYGPAPSVTLRMLRSFIMRNIFPPRPNLFCKKKIGNPSSTTMARAAMTITGLIKAIISSEAKTSNNLFIWQVKQWQPSHAGI